MSINGSPPQRVLIINIFGIGDVLFTTPMISNLKASHPDLYIGYVCNSRTAAILERNPKIDKVIIYDRDDFNEASQRSKISAFKKLIGFLTPSFHKPQQNIECGRTPKIKTEPNNQCGRRPHSVHTKKPRKTLGVDGRAKSPSTHCHKTQ